jgi:hypothetical protein
MPKIRPRSKPLVDLVARLSMGTAQVSPSWDHGPCPSSFVEFEHAKGEAHALVRQVPTGSGDIDPRDGTLTVRLDPLPYRPGALPPPSRNSVNT